MKKIITLTISKTAIFMLDKLGRGTVLPGKIALTLDKHIAHKLKKPSKVIVVTGSSGKGSTSSLIARLLRSQNYTVTYNDGDSNLTNGILTTLIKDADLKGNIDSDFLVLEIDERFLKETFKFVKPDYLLITNITRDQPPRNGHFEAVINEVKKGLLVNSHLILNGDDPILRTFVTNKEKVTLYGINKTDFSYDEKLNRSLNLEYCPKCGEKLKYDYYHVEGYGKFKCDSCTFKREEPHFKATKVDYDKMVIKVNSKYELCLKEGMLHSIYTTLAAFSVCSLLGLDMDKIPGEIESYCTDYKNKNIQKYKKINIYNIPVKNENSSSFNFAINYVDRFKNKKNIVLGWNFISRRYEYKDVSWLYDIDFEILSDHKINNIVIFGPNNKDIEKRLILGGFNKDNIILVKDLDELLNHIVKNPEFDYFNIVENLGISKKVFTNIGEHLNATEKKLGEYDG